MSIAQSIMPPTVQPKARTTGYTLIELAMVLLILAILLGGLWLPLSAQREVQQQSETRKRLAQAQEALIGFALANDRLPCPASPNSSGVESLNPPLNANGGGDCSHPYNGFLPAITLGLAPSDSQGYALDAWGYRLRYAVTTNNAAAFTSSLKSAWIGGLSPNLIVCNSARLITGKGNSADCTTTNAQINNAVAVLFSTGKNGGLSPPTGADELANLAGIKIFVSHTPRPADAPQGEFDDIVVWLSPYVLYNRLIASGRLP